MVGSVLIEANPTDPATQLFEIKGDVLIHDGYSMTNKDNDIAIITTDIPIVLVPNKVAIVCLPDINTPIPTGLDLNIAAWGKETADQESPYNPHLQNTTILAECDSFCSIVASNGNLPPYNPVTTFCAQQTNKGFCNGDEGGPAYSENNGKYYQYGIISRQEGCGTSPGYYTRVGFFKQWIQNNLGKCLTC